MRELFRNVNGFSISFGALCLVLVLVSVANVVQAFSGWLSLPISRSVMRGIEAFVILTITSILFGLLMWSFTRGD